VHKNLFTVTVFFLLIKREWYGGASLNDSVVGCKDPSDIGTDLFRLEFETFEAVADPDTPKSI